MADWSDWRNRLRHADAIDWSFGALFFAVGILAAAAVYGWLT